MIRSSHRVTDFWPQEESDPIETTFELNDTLYAKASIPPTDEVYLWLGVCQVSSLLSLDISELLSDQNGTI